MHGLAYQVLEERAKPPPATTHSHRQQMQADIFAGALAALLVVVFNVIIAGVVFSPGDELSDSMSNGVVLAFVTTCSTGAVMLLLSPLPIVTGGDVFLAAMYGRHMKPELLDQDEPFATLVVAMAMCSFFLGVTFWALGAAQAGKLVQFLPSPVMQGYLAAMGYVMIDSAAAMATGCGLQEVGCLQASPDAPQLAMAMALGVALYVAQRLTRGLTQTFLTPALLLLLALGFALLRAWLGVAALAPWTMHVSASPASAWRALLPVSSLGSASWQAALQAAASTASVVMHPHLNPDPNPDPNPNQAAASTASVVMLPVAVGRLLGISAIESRGDVDVDYNRELRVPNAVMYAAPCLPNPNPNPFSTPCLPNHNPNPNPNQVRGAGHRGLHAVRHERGLLADDTRPGRHHQARAARGLGVLRRPHFRGCQRDRRRAQGGLRHGHVQRRARRPPRQRAARLGAAEQLRVRHGAAARAADRHLRPPLSSRAGAALHRRELHRRVLAPLGRAPARHPAARALQGAARRGRPRRHRRAGRGRVHRAPARHDLLRIRQLCR